MKRILFVCTGNTCRSPMAQGLMNRYAHEHGYELQATSAGIAANGGDAISENALKALEEEGIDMSYHRARQLCDADISNAAAIYCMTESHMAAVAAIFPKATDKLHLLGTGISDPFGGDIEMYRGCRDEIKKCLPDAAAAVGFKG